MSAQKLQDENERYPSPANLSCILSFMLLCDAEL